MRRRQIIVPLLLSSLILVSLTACNPLGDEGETTEQLVEVVRGDLMVSVSGSGNIEASREARLSFGSGGRIEKIYVEEGDEVSKGEVLAELDTDALELAKTQAEVALTQAQLALTQAKLSQQTAEYELKNIRDTKDALELTLFNAQIDVRNAKHHLDETQDIYTWPDIETAQKDVDNAEAFLQYVLDEGLSAATVAYAQARLEAAEAILDAKVYAYDTEEVAIARLQLEAAEMAEAQAQKNLDKLTEDIAIKELQIEAAKESVEQAKQSVVLARVSLAQTQKELDEAIITATIDGVVTEVTAEEGDIIPSPSFTAKPIIHLIDPSSMELIVEVDEIDIPEVSLGQEAIIELDALPDVELIGNVTTIFPMPIEVGGVVVYRVKIIFDVPEGPGIKVGMSAEADIVLAKRSNVLLVPDRAIEEDEEGKTIVKVMVGEEMEERPVEIGISDGFNTEIISGLREGEVVIETRVKR
ncbi:MAG: efflux RND transporter periplasmic adaptor subunit [Dehalococcoidales bacterium]